MLVTKILNFTGNSEGLVTETLSFKGNSEELKLKIDSDFGKTSHLLNFQNVSLALFEVLQSPFQLAFAAKIRCVDPYYLAANANFMRKAAANFRRKVLDSRRMEHSECLPPALSNQILAQTQPLSFDFD